MENRFPAELRDLPNWICHAKKVPKNPKSGRNCVGSTEKWGCDFETAMAAMEKFDFDGLGFVFKSADPFIGVDLDSCIDEKGNIAGWAQRCVDEFDSYTERSPSEKGLHIIIQADQLVSYKRHPIEIYSNKRYFTMTGNCTHSPDTVNRWKGGDIVQAVSVHLRDQMCENPFTDEQLALTDIEIERVLNKARKSGNGRKFQDLFGGNWKDEYTSQSEADLALCAILAFHTNNNQLHIDQLFRRSGLFRDKWDRMAGGGKTYGQVTIQRCVTSNDEQQPPMPPVAGYIKPLAEFMARQYPPQEIILEPWLFTGSTHMLYAQRGIGKTFFGMTLVLSIAYKQPFLDWRVVKPVNILYVDGEMPGPSMQKRFTMLKKNFNGCGMQSEIFVLSSADLAFDGYSSINVSGQQGKGWRDTIMEGIMEHDIKMVVLDNLSALTPGIEENDSSAWGEIGQWLGQIKHCGCAVMFIHHENKKGEQRGTSAREDALDCVIKLLRAEDATEEAGINVDVVFTKHRNVEYIPRRNFMVVSEGSDDIRCHGGIDTQGVTQQKVDAIGLLIGGRTHREVSDILNISSKTVTSIKKQAIEEEWITKEDGKLITTPIYDELKKLFYKSNDEF